MSILFNVTRVIRGSLITLSVSAEVIFMGPGVTAGNGTESKYGLPSGTKEINNFRIAVVVNEVTYELLLL